MGHRECSCPGANQLHSPEQWHRDGHFRQRIDAPLPLGPLVDALPPRVAPRARPTRCPCTLHSGLESAIAFQCRATLIQAGDALRAKCGPSPTASGWRRMSLTSFGSKADNTWVSLGCCTHLAVWGLLISCLTSACSKDDCFSDVEGKSYRVTIVEPWDESSAFPGGPPMPFPCPSGFDLPSGSSFVVHIDGTSDHHSGCSCSSASIVAGPSGWSWSGSTPADICSDAFFMGESYSASNDVCSGSLFLRLEAIRVPTGKEVPGSPPVAHLDRRFYPATNADGGLLNPDCPIAPPDCRDIFVVEIAQN